MTKKRDPPNITTFFPDDRIRKTFLPPLLYLLGDISGKSIIDIRMWKWALLQDLQRTKSQNCCRL